MSRPKRSTHLAVKTPTTTKTPQKELFDLSSQTNYKTFIIDVSNVKDPKELRKQLQIRDTIHDFGRTTAVMRVLGLDLNIYAPNFEKTIRDSLYKDKRKCTINQSDTNIYEILDKLFEDRKNREVVVERSGKAGISSRNHDEYCYATDILYRTINTVANDYDNATATKRDDIKEELCVENKRKTTTITTTEDDGLLIIDNVELSKQAITYKIDGNEKKINFPEKQEKEGESFRFGAPVIRQFIQGNVYDEFFTERIKTIFELDYEQYKNTEGDKKKYIKCLFDFKRLGDLQLIKVAAKENISFITGDRLAAIIANKGYGIPSLYISSTKTSPVELYTKNKTCTIYKNLKNIIDYLLNISYTNEDDYKEEVNKFLEDNKKYLEHLNDVIFRGEEQKDSGNERKRKRKGGNPQEPPEKMNEDRWYYSVGLLKIIDEYLPQDEDRIGDNTVLLFQYMLLGYVYDLHDEDVIDHVQEYLEYNNVKQSVPSQSNKLQTFQPDIPEKGTLSYDKSIQYTPYYETQANQQPYTRTPYNIKQSVSKGTPYTDIYDDAIMDDATSTSITNIMGGKHKTTKFMKNVIKDFKKLFV